MNDQLQVNTEIIDIDKLKPNPRNPRTITKPAMERLKHQLWKLGQYKPIIIDTRTGLIIGGHMRYEALKLLGVDKVMVSYITSENDQEALEYALSDNDEAGTTVQEQLLGLIEQYPDIKLEDYAVKFDEGETLRHFLDQFSTEVSTDDSQDTKAQDPQEDEKKLVKCPNCNTEFNV